ncbi:MAG TPA: hypothetical protein VIM28_00860 [Solirubrobacterales bacterium]
MDRTLFVIVGAGASHDAAGHWSNAVQPPLVSGLFSHKFDAILSRYPMAQSAAPEIRNALRQGRDGQAISLESHLRKMYRDSDDPYDRRRFFSITLYLQDLLWQASRREGVHFDNTDLLVGVLIRHFDHVCFLTLNYDTILDQALGKLDQISRMDHYAYYGRWSLIKLHGSVDWGYRPTSNVDVDEPPADLERFLDDQIYLGVDPREDEGTRNQRPPRYAFPRSMNETKLFPALTVPVGEEDEVVCPPAHQSFLDRRLAAQTELDLLILGYSAYDRTVLERIKRSEKRIRSLTVVNEDREGADKVAERLKRVIPQSLNGAEIHFAQRPFGAWCRSELDDFIAGHPALQ